MRSSDDAYRTPDEQIPGFVRRFNRMCYLMLVALAMILYVFVLRKFVIAFLQTIVEYFYEPVDYYQLPSGLLPH